VWLLQDMGVEREGPGNSRGRGSGGRTGVKVNLLPRWLQVCILYMGGGMTVWFLR
jgi:hypothetical protein